MRHLMSVNEASFQEEELSRRVRLSLLLNAIKTGVTGYPFEASINLTH